MATDVNCVVSKGAFKGRTPHDLAANDATRHQLHKYGGIPGMFAVFTNFMLCQRFHFSPEDDKPINDPLSFFESRYVKDDKQKEQEGGQYAHDSEKGIEDDEELEQCALDEFWN
jgi:hypothetical protein